MFEYLSFAQQVVFGPGSLVRLGELVDRFGWRRLMLCTSRSLRANGHAAAVEAALGGRLAAVFDQVQPHVPDTQVTQVVEMAERAQVDALAGLGGGSPIGMAKAAAFAMEERRLGRPARSTAPTAQPLVPVVAIPTTYAGSEMTAVFGVTQTGEDPPRKVTRSDPKIAPRLVLYDPALILDLPPGLTASTGMNALAHCFEALYSPTRNPLASAAALEGLRRILHALPCCYAHPGDLEARTEMLEGAYLAGQALAGVKMAIHHGLCHVLGGAAGVPHGIANSIMLPHALRFNARAVAPQLRPAVEALGIPYDERDPAAAVERAAERVAGLAAEMRLPGRLRDAGIEEADLPRLARLGFENPTVHNNPRPVESVQQVEEIFRAAW